MIIDKWFEKQFEDFC